MCVLTVQSDVGYATHVSTKPLPIWSSSRKDWSDWSMEPAYEHANQTRDVSQDKLSRGTNPTAMGIDDWLGAASRDERTSDRCAHARWMHVIPSHAHATIACARQKHRHPRANMIDDLAMDDVEALRIRHESTYHNLARAGRARARAARVREINASFLIRFKTSHGQSRRRGKRVCERGRFSTTSRVTTSPRATSFTSRSTAKQIIRNTSNSFVPSSVVVVARTHVPQPRRECTCRPRTRSRFCHPAHRG
jgi:hypothetical protein